MSYQAPEIKTSLIAWGVFLTGTCCYCLLYQGFVASVTPDFGRTLTLALKEWGVWFFTTPMVFARLSRGMNRVRLAASAVLVSLAVLVLIDQATDTRSVLSSVIIFLPRYIAAIVVVYLVWHVFLRVRPRVPETLLVSKGADECLVHVDRVQHVSAAGNYVDIHAGDQTYLLRATMRQVEDLLPEPRFVRIHRSHLVNTNDIERIRIERSGSGSVHLRGGKTLALSKKYRAALQKYRPQLH